MRICRQKNDSLICITEETMLWAQWLTLTVIPASLAVFEAGDRLRLEDENSNSGQHGETPSLY